ncbi:D-Ala-D-Ala carboxypeptidase family metallohydrolase [Halocella sp. SP3-1]|uniref:YcbK family protein n=1 Tax=Halocella sp. SP3-1 TaxID=2382161 RepID=UPI002570618E|nr:D-Ala-D-Ala carboxypeptidase family metallohydrolase [Halocella sp. SP3-1]
MFTIINNIKISKNFYLSEFECKDGNHQVVIDSELIDKLQKLRDYLGQAIVINSSYRNESHNKSVGGSPNSQHLKGKAVDIRRIEGLTIDEMVAIAEDAGFNGIGKYNWGIHIDVRENKARWDMRG